MRVLFGILLVIQGGLIAGQELTQRVRGKVIDATTGSALPGANIRVLGAEEYGTSSGSDGQFLLEEVAIGRYRLEATFVGYEPFTLAELQINASKEIVIEVALLESQQQLEGVEVVGKDVLNTQDFISARTITVEETQRFAASFYDPARLASSFPGVVTSNDQANNIAVRGNSPNALRWWLEGVEIVNPNHTSNAGTLSDKPTQNGGGVNMLSAQLLDNSQFITGGFAPQYTNVQSGLLDMRLRKGNDQRREYVAQASLLGLEFAAEGPFSKNSKSSYLVNYRYSTVGVLSAMGIDFGGEAISFQDLSFNLTFPIQNGTIKLFGVGGLSRNTFTGERDSSQWTEEKSSRDIRFRSGMGTAGLKLDKSLNARLSLFTTLAWSGVGHEREADQINFDGTLSRIQNFESQESKASLHSGLRSKIGASNELLFGLHVVNHRFETIDEDLGESFVNDNATNLRIAPYANFRLNLSSSFLLNAGLQLHYSSLNNEAVPEPRLSVKWRAGGPNVLRASFSRSAQSLSSYALLTGSGANKELKMMKSNQFILGYYTFLGSVRAKLEGYYQSLSDVAVEFGGSSYSVVNDLTVSKPVVMSSDGTGENYGVDISLERFFDNNFYSILSSSIYNSSYQGYDRIDRDTRFNGGYTINLAGGKEWTKSSKNRTLGLNARVFYFGGLKDTPIDENASRQTGRTVFIESQAFTLQNNDYFRIDLRLSTTKHKPNYTRIISLDIQNVIGIENDAYLYFDQFQDRTVTAKQLGIIPVLAYRVEF